MRSNFIHSNCHLESNNNSFWVLLCERELSSDHSLQSRKSQLSDGIRDSRSYHCIVLENQIETFHGRERRSLREAFSQKLSHFRNNWFVLRDKSLNRWLLEVDHHKSDHNISSICSREQYLREFAVELKRQRGFHSVPKAKRKMSYFVDLCRLPLRNYIQTISRKLGNLHNLQAWGSRRSHSNVIFWWQLIKLKILENRQKSSKWDHFCLNWARKWKLPFVSHW